MSLTEHLGGVKAELTQIRRCQWCIERTGADSYCVGKDWIHIPNPVHYFGTAKFTDGMCPDCLAWEKLKIKSQAK